MNRTDVEKIARLARLSLAEQAIPDRIRDLSGILGLVERMNRTEAEGVEPLAHPHELTQRLRPDQATEGDRRERLQRNAPQAAEGLILVPQVIE